jgi:hypothetical protein
MSKKDSDSQARAKKLWRLATTGDVDLVPVLDDRQIAEQLHRYLKFRANQEGQQYSLDPQFFLDALQQNVTKFFGIKVYLGGLESDEQNPEAFAKWTALN